MCNSTEAIDNLYEKLGLTYCKDCRKHGSVDCYYLCESNHAPFTAEKQFELIKWLGKHKQGLGIDFYNEWSVGVKFEWEAYKYTKESKSFEEALASVTCDIWDLLSEEEKEEVKGILK